MYILLTSSVLPILRSVSSQQAMNEGVVRRNLNRAVPDDTAVRLPTQETP